VLWCWALVSLWLLLVLGLTTRATIITTVMGTMATITAITMATTTTATITVIIITVTDLVRTHGGLWRHVFLIQHSPSMQLL